MQKICALSTGKAPVALDCQIPGLRNIYERCNLKSNEGYFVEIGGFDGDAFSNTSFLADQGWSGVYIEPIRDFCDLIRWRHCLNIFAVANVAISSELGMIEIFRMGQLSTCIEASKKHLENIYWVSSLAKAAKNETVRAECLENTLIYYKVPEIFDLLVVDVEGKEEVSVRQLFDSRYRPRLLVIDLVDTHPDFANNETLIHSHTQIRQMLTSQSFQQVFSDSASPHTALSL
jgi:hypothetical protein